MTNVMQINCHARPIVMQKVNVMQTKNVMQIKNVMQRKNVMQNVMQE